MNNDLFQNYLLPKTAVITDIIYETDKEKRFKIKFADSSVFNFKPGQFLIMSIMGVGEAPFSISTDDLNVHEFEICVRNVGDVSGALHQKAIGDTVGIRGPFGSYFDTKDYEGCDVLFIAGGLGLVPLRPVISQVLNERDKYKRVTLLYGSKSIDDMVYKNFIKGIEQKNIDVDITLDDSKNSPYKQGLITNLVNEYEFDISTKVLICGPPIMYKFVLQLLKNKGVSNDDIFVSLERHMKCGVGRCGHCRIDDVCVCKSGPVFKYSDICTRRGAF